MPIWYTSPTSRSKIHRMFIGSRFAFHFPTTKIFFGTRTSIPVINSPFDPKNHWKRQSIASTHSLSRCVSTTAPARRAHDNVQSLHTSEWLPKIGLELHVQLASGLKLFSSGWRDDWLESHAIKANLAMSSFDAAIPGIQPKLSADCLRLGLLASIALKCTIPPLIRFDRKHYFYPDNPNGYQITQHYAPLATKGHVHLGKTDGLGRSLIVGIMQVQLEQDTAKSHREGVGQTSYVDLNRSGSALIEVVTEPDLTNAAEAVAFVRKVQKILRHIGVSAGTMEDGSLRCDINVSVEHKERSEKSQRCEIKNVNGFGNIQSAIESEVHRHIKLLSESKPVSSETRGFDVMGRKTFHLRFKDKALDYRYIPDPDVPPLIVPPSFVKSLEEAMPPSPDEIIAYLTNDLGVRQNESITIFALLESCKQLSFLTGGIQYFKSALSNIQHASPQTVASWMCQELLGSLSKAAVEFLDCPLGPSDFAFLVDAAVTKQVTRVSVRQILQEVVTCQSPREASSMAHEMLTKAQLQRDEYSVSHAELANSLVQSMTREVGAIKEGKHRVVMAMVGEGMRRSNGQIDAVALRKELCILLGIPDT